MSGEELARQLVVCLPTELAISSDNLLTCMRNRASVNSVAVRMLIIVFPNSLTLVVSLTQLTMLENASIIQYLMVVQVGGNEAYP